MADRDLTPAEARAEVEAFMGESWKVRVQASEYRHVWADCGMCCVEGHEPTFRAAVSALRSAWRDAVRPWMEAAIDAKLDTADVDGYAPNERVIAHVLKEDSNG